MSFPVTPSGIEPATFRFVAQHLNHCATAVPPPRTNVRTRNVVLFIVCCMCESGLTFLVSSSAGDFFQVDHIKIHSVFCRFFVEFAKISESACYLHDVCPSVRMEQLGCHWRILMKFDICVFFENLSRDFKFD